MLSETRTPLPKHGQVDSASLWYKDAVIYQVHVKAFADGNGDGIGDFAGLLKKLDYLQSLGITALWVLPFYPSPLRDDGYDIADYYNVNPSYGTLLDFKNFLKEAHRRGLKVITELVINHTSDQHPWFQRARRAPAGSSERNFYVWNDTTEKYKDARIIFKDFEPSNWTWDSVAKAYYWHRFYYHQPDLNFDNPAVQKAIFKVLDFWMELGVDGVRLDAIPYLFEREGTHCENLPETHAFLRAMRAHVDKKFSNRMLLAEANQWPEDAVAYFGNGDSCHMAFHFPVMPRMFMALQMEDRYPVIDILEQTPTIPENCQWAIFLRNHDELTLEMVTDEERDYMYRVYATDPRARINLGIRRRLAPLLGNNRRKIELINILLFSLPGTPIIYYGDEIGMGDNIYLGDRNGVRTPMQWSADRNAGFSRANPQQLYLPVIIDPEYQYEAINVETQEQNLSSLLYWMRRVITMRRRYLAFSRGKTEFVSSDNPKLLSFIRHYKEDDKEEILLVIVNLSRFAQAVELDLSQYAGFTPREVFSQNPFPVIKGNMPYALTVGPHGHYWLILEPENEVSTTHTIPSLPIIKGIETWAQFLNERNGHLKQFLQKILPSYLPTRRWFRSKSRRIQEVSILEAIPIGDIKQAAQLLWIRVTFTEGLPEVYILPIAIAWDQVAEQIRNDFPQAVIAELEKLSAEETRGVLYDAVYNENLRHALLQLIIHKKKLRSSTNATCKSNGQLQGIPSPLLKSLIQKSATTTLNSQLVNAEQSNTSILYENTFFLKLYRKVEDGENPDIELTRFLTEQRHFNHVPPFGGLLEYKTELQLTRSRVGIPGQAQIVALLQGVVPNEGDAWTLTVEAAARYLERVLSSTAQPQFTEPTEFLSQLSPRLVENDFASVKDPLHSMIGAIYPERANLLGQRTGELHCLLASEPTDPALMVEPFTTHYQRALLQSINIQIRRVWVNLRWGQHKVQEQDQPALSALLERQSEAMALAENTLRTGKLFQAVKMRIHGDFHLGQVLFTGKDFVMIDFEGEPAKPLSERKLKRCPLADVAGILRSFHYAIYTALHQKITVLPEVAQALQPWAEVWYYYIAGTFLRGYLQVVGGSGLVPNATEDLESLLKLYLLDKVVYELGYEINNRPTWIHLPIRGLERILGNK